MNNIHNGKLVCTRVFEEKAMQDISDSQRPSFHVSSPVGWINDPNGFSVFKGEYHLFFQYHPYDIHWGPMHWGHMKTKDFTKWENLPAALAPDEKYDIAGCFSGTAIEVEGKHILMYTGVTDDIQPDKSHVIRQTQCIAIGDGINYEKSKCNPVITGEMLPKGSNREDFRDPKIWRDGELYFALVANRSEDESGDLILFKSEDLKQWERCSVVEKCNNEYGKMWECPDLFKLNDKDVIIISPQDMQAKELEIHNGNGNIYFIGEYDKKEYTFNREVCGVLDYGLDYYAPQTLQALDGRRILIAWMESWDNYLTPIGFKWSGMMTLPRELEIRDGKIVQKPIQELENYWVNPVEYKNHELKGLVEIPEIQGRELDMEIEVLSGEYKSLQIMLACNEEFCTKVIYDPYANVITFDRKCSGLRRDVICERQMKVSGEAGKIKMRIILDKYSVELFVNDGEQVMTAVYFTNLDAKRIKFAVDGTAVVNIVKHDIVVK